MQYNQYQQASAPPPPQGKNFTNIGNAVYEHVFILVLKTAHALKHTVVCNTEEIVNS